MSRTRCRIWRPITWCAWLAAIGATAVALEDLEAGADRRQRVAQLVGQGGQELVLAAIGFDQPDLAVLQLAVDRAERFGPLVDPLFEFGQQAFAVRLEGLEAGQQAARRRRPAPSRR